MPEVWTCDGNATDYQLGVHDKIERITEVATSIIIISCENREGIHEKDNTEVHIDIQPTSTSVTSSCVLSLSGFVFMRALSGESMNGLRNRHANIHNDDSVMIRIRRP